MSILSMVKGVVAMKKRTVSQAVYALQLLIHEIPHDDMPITAEVKQ